MAGIREVTLDVVNIACYKAHKMLKNEVPSTAI